MSNAILAEITHRAEAAVGTNPPASLSIPSLEEQIEGLPPEAGPLRRVLESEAVRALFAKKNACDREAVAARRHYDLICSSIIVLVLAAIVVGMFALVNPDALIQRLAVNKTESQWVSTVLIYACLILTLLLARQLARKRSYETWSEKRGSAEFLRRRLFETVMETPATSHPGELPLLPLKLEYFRRYQLDVQELYHGVRARQYTTAVKWLRRLVIPVLVLVAIWAVFFLAEIASAYEEQGPLPDVIPSFVYSLAAGLQWLSTYYLDLLWLQLGVAFALLYGAYFLVTTLHASLRNAARFERAHDNMVYLRATGLEDARLAAAAGEDAKVANYVNRVHSVMSAECADWIRLMDLEAGFERPSPVPAGGIA